MRKRVLQAIIIYQMLALAYCPGGRGFKCLDHALHAKCFVTYKPKHDRAAADVVPHCVGRMDGDVDGCLQEKNLVGSWR